MLDGGAGGYEELEKRGEREDMETEGEQRLPCISCRLSKAGY